MYYLDGWRYRLTTILCTIIWRFDMRKEPAMFIDLVTLCPIWNARILQQVQARMSEWCDIIFHLLCFPSLSRDFTYLRINHVTIYRYMLCKFLVGSQLVQLYGCKITEKRINTRCQPSGQHSCFIVGRFWVHISAWKPAILTEVFCFFLFLPRKLWNNNHKLGHDCFLLYLFQAVNH